MAGCPALPPYLLELLADAVPSTHGALASNPASPPDLLAAFCLDPSSGVRRAAAANPATPPERIALLVSAGSAPDLSAHVEPLQALPERELRALAALGGWGACLAASNPRSPPALLEQLTRGDDSEITRRVAANPATPAACLRALAGRRDHDRPLAANPSSPADLLWRLARGSRDLQHIAAANPSAPPDLLWHSAGSPEERIRRAAARNPGFPAGRRALLDRAGFPPDLSGPPPVFFLLDDEDFADLLGAGEWLAEYALRHPSLPPSRVEQLASSPSTSVRCHIALRRGLPARVLERLRNDREPGIRALLGLAPAARGAPASAPG